MVVHNLPGEIPVAMTALSGVGTGDVDLVGASGELQFNPKGEPESGPMDIWMADYATGTFVKVDSQ